MNYQEFLNTKRLSARQYGFDYEPPGFLFPFQREIVRRALKIGRFSIFADCGLGKTPMQLEWGKAVSEYTEKPVLIFAPLAVAEQTRREGMKFGIPVTLVEKQADICPGVNVSNYEKIHHFTPEGLGGMVLDESGILKNYGGHYRKLLTNFAQSIDYRLCCTATPAPNDLIEIINHAEFLGVLSGKEAIALFFKTDGNTTHSWRIKKHAENDFWRWVASWSVAIRMPSDLGYNNGEFVLPKLNIIQHTVSGHISEGFLFQVEAHTMQERRQARKESMDSRVKICAELANANELPWLCWCGLNAESELLRKSINGAVEVKGSDKPEDKRDRMIGFSDGIRRVLVTKPSIAGFGMNWQHCYNMAFVGLSDSFEELYQGIRRCWRFGQKNTVNVNLVVADTEGAVLQNVQRKERDHAEMMAKIIDHMGQEYGRCKDDSRYTGKEKVEVPSWAMK